MSSKDYINDSTICIQRIFNIVPISFYVACDKKWNQDQFFCQTNKKGVDPLKVIFVGNTNNIKYHGKKYNEKKQPTLLQKLLSIPDFKKSFNHRQK